MRFSVSQKGFNTSKFSLILSKKFLDLGMESVYEKMTTYKILTEKMSFLNENFFYIETVFITNITYTFL